MYCLREFMQSFAGISYDTVTSDEVYCLDTDLSNTCQTNRMQQALSAYSYTIVLQGWLKILYNGQELTLYPDDLYIYSPGFQVSVLDGSADYKGMCLFADDHMTLSMPIIWNVVRTAYYPIYELGNPVVHLNHQQASHLLHRMHEIADYLNSSHHFLKECLHTVYTLFVLDLRDFMESAIGVHNYGERTIDLFVKFAYLLPRHFIDHHDIGFYADKLHITTTHLSRVVRSVSGRTVLDHVNQMLLMESSWLLQTTSLSLAEIAERLNFADQSSFGKFYHRMKGMSPKAYRQLHKEAMNIGV